MPPPPGVAQESVPLPCSFAGALPRPPGVATESAGAELLAWVASQPAARVHPLVRVARDAHGGLGLFMQQAATGGAGAGPGTRPHPTQGSLPQPTQGSLPQPIQSTLDTKPTQASPQGPSTAAEHKNVQPVSAAMLGGSALPPPPPAAAKFTELLAVPRSCMLEAPPGVAPPYQHAALALRLLHEREAGSASAWSSYVASLPTEDALACFHLPAMHLRELEQQQQEQQHHQQHNQQHHQQRQQQQHALSQESQEQQQLRQLLQQPLPADGTTVVALLSASPSALVAFARVWEALVWEHSYVVPPLCGQAPPVRWWLQPRARGAAVAAETRAAGGASAHTAAPPPGPPSPPMPRGWEEDIVAHAGLKLRALPSFREYVWARGIVASRAIRLWGGPTLVPLVDFLNHHHPPSVFAGVGRTEPPGTKSPYSPPSTPSSHSSEDSGGSLWWLQGVDPRPPPPPPLEWMVVSAVCDIPTGSELLWVYGAHDHDAGWLIGYGFVPDDNSSSRPNVALEAGGNGERDCGSDRCGGEAGDGGETTRPASRVSGCMPPVVKSGGGGGASSEDERLAQLSLSGGHGQHAVDCCMAVGGTAANAATPAATAATATATAAATAAAAIGASAGARQQRLASLDASLAAISAMGDAGGGFAGVRTLLARERNALLHVGDTSAAAGSLLV